MKQQGNFMGKAKQIFHLRTVETQYNVFTPVISAFRRLRLEDSLEFDASIHCIRSGSSVLANKTMSEYSLPTFFASKSF